MEGMNIIELYQTGGMALLFIGFQAWLVRYFMKQIDQFREERKLLQQQFDTVLNNHCMKVTSALVEQRHTFEMLCAKIDELVDALNHKE
ncbi:TPA: hypothetical protein EYP66_02055 [Candidatus Poribacteria bacterium]|nr:hypothetical protein [Candidatus Poribacteria bacterium]